MSNKENILIINPTGGSPYHGPNLRSYYLARNLNEIGYNTSIICNAFFHKFQKLPNVENRVAFEDIDGINYFWIRTNPYDTRGVRQVINQGEFVFRVYQEFKGINFPKPDYVICSSPPPFAVFSAKKIADYYESKLIFEIRDLWPLVIKQLGNFSSIHPYILLLKLTEWYAYTKADHVVSVKPGDIHYLKEKYDFNSSNFTYIPNGYDLNNEKKSPSKDYKEALPRKKFIIGYVGSLSVAYGIEYLVRAAQRLQHVEEVHFVIVGDGPDEKKLRELCDREGIDNIIFLGRVPNKDVPKILESIDVCYLGYKKADWLKYGISSNKMFDYMSQAKPIISAVETAYNPVDSADCGLTVQPEDDKAIAEAIESLLNMKYEKLTEMGENGKEYLINNHSYRKIAQLYSNVFENI